MRSGPRRVFQAHFDEADDLVIRLLKLSGEEHCRLVVSRTERLVIIEKKCILAAGNSSDIDVVLPSGEHLRKTIVRNLSATIAEVLHADASPSGSRLSRTIGANAESEEVRCAWDGGG